MDLIIRAHQAFWGHATFPCVIGRGGITPHKHEGDGATPCGRFPFRRVMYRADRVEKPQTLLPVTPISVQDGWCDAPDDLLYNFPVVLPYSASCENLWRADYVYDLILVVGHNDAPVEPGKGSAVFVHLARECKAPTEGCVAFSKGDLYSILSACTKDSALVVEC